MMSRRRTSNTVASLTTASAIIALLLLLTTRHDGGLLTTVIQNYSTSRKLQQAQQEARQQRRERPILTIHTFYAPLLRVSPDSQREQHIRQADERLLEEWKQAWTDAGFVTKILSSEDAQKHPLYNTMKDRLRQITLLGEGGRNREYNEYCFYRFLAMAAVGGGLMSDYDVVPLFLLGDDNIADMMTTALHHHHQDVFTIYSEALNGSGGIPCLASGSSSEWTRMAQLMMDTTKNDDSTTATTQWSDMVALMKLHQRAPDQHYKMENHIVGAKDYVRGQSSHWSCPPAASRQQQTTWAMHFSHYDTMAAGHRVPTRAKLIHEYRQWWKENCNKI